MFLIEFGVVVVRRSVTGGKKCLSIVLLSKDQFVKVLILFTLMWFNETLAFLDLPEDIQIASVAEPGIEHNNPGLCNY